MIRFIVFTLALATWLIPIKVASAEFQHSEETPIFLNYAQFHKTTPLQQLLPEEPVSSNGKQLVRRDSSAKPNANISSEKFSGRTYSKEEIITLIVEYSRQYGIASEAPLCIAKYESGYNQFSKNKSSSASGVFQYLSGTWKATDEGKAGLSVFDAEANVKAAIKYMASRLNSKPWVVGPECPQVTRI